MGKVIKSVLKVAAFVAIATFAAPIAGAIGLSSVVGATVGSAVVGAAMGAATNAVLGGGVGMGALLGGLSGGLGGLFGGAANAPPAAAQGAATAGEGLAAAAPAVAAPAAAATGAAPLGAAFEGITVTAPHVANAATGLAGAAALGGATAGAADFTSTPVAAGVTPTPPATPTATPTATTVGLTPPSTFVDPATQAAVSQYANAPLAATPAAAATPTSAAGGATFGSRIGNVAKAVAPQLISSLVSQGDTGALLAAQQRQIEEQNRLYERNYNLKTQGGQDLMNDANYYDPQTFGRTAAESARVKAGIAGNNAARAAATTGGALSGEQAAIRRQAQLAGGRNATADYWSAYGTGANARTSTRAAGLNQIPLGNPPGSDAYTSALANARADQSGTAALINSGIRAWNYGNTGDPNDPNTPKNEAYYP